MALVIGTNMSSLAAQRSLQQSEQLMSKSMERLSSGSKINTAADDAAGLALSNRMDNQATSLHVAIKNMNDGIALTEAIEGSLNEVEDILMRMRALATQAASDTTAAKDRTTLNAELQTLNNELTAMSQRTTYAGQNILDGTFTSKLIQVGTESGETVSVSQSSIAATALGGFTKVGDSMTAKSHADDMASARAAVSATGDTFTITPSGGSATANFADTEQSAKQVAAAINLQTGTTGITATAYSRAQLSEFDDATVAIKVNDSTIASVNLNTQSGRDTFVSNVNAATATHGVTASAVGTTIELLANDGRNIELERTDATASVIKVKAMTQAGAAGTEAEFDGTTGTEFAVVKGIITLSSDKDFAVDITGTSVDGFFTAFSNADTSFVSAQLLTTQANASTALASIDGAIDRVSSMRADLGAISNRLSHAADAAIVLRENTLAGSSRLQDADFAEESANLAKAQVLQQVATAMLAQANAQPQLALQLLQ